MKPTNLFFVLIFLIVVDNSKRILFEGKYEEIWKMRSMDEFHMEREEQVSMVDNTCPVIQCGGPGQTCNAQIGNIMYVYPFIVIIHKNNNYQLAQITTTTTITTNNNSKDTLIMC
jgi:hypothetical protein